MFKYIVALFLYFAVCLTLFGPFILILLGFYKVFISQVIIGIILVILGLILLKLIKPLSILFNKDFKIF